MLDNCEENCLNMLSVYVFFKSFDTNKWESEDDNSRKKFHQKNKRQKRKPDKYERKKNKFLETRALSKEMIWAVSFPSSNGNYIKLSLFLQNVSLVMCVCMCV